MPAYPGDKAFLFEVHPQFMPPNIDSELFQIRVKGRLPVMAHPERYVEIQRNPEVRRAYLGGVPAS